MDKFWYGIKEDNDTKVQEMCKKKLDLAFKGYIEEKLKKKEYKTAGGYPKFQRDVERLKEEYVSNLSDYEENEVWRVLEMYIYIALSTNSIELVFPPFSYNLI
jgi:hypothetical protein